MLDDYDAFLTGLEQDPYQGTSLGKGVRKVRMAIASKGKGKSGGARVITYIRRQRNINRFIRRLRPSAYP